MHKNTFFKRDQRINLNNLFPNTNFEKKDKLNNVKALKKAEKFDLTFFDSIKYKSNAQKTKASYCITTKRLKNFLPPSVKLIIVDNVLYELAKILIKLYYYFTVNNYIQNRYKYLLM